MVKRLGQWNGRRRSSRSEVPLLPHLRQPSVLIRLTAVLATVASDHTHSLVQAGSATLDAALAAGYARAFLVAGVLAVVGVVATFIVPFVRHPTEAVAPIHGEPELGVEPA